MIGVQGDNRAVMAATTQTFRRLGQLTGFSQRTILLGEAGSILKRWAGLAKVSTQAEADRRSRLHGVRRMGYTGSTRAKNRGDVTVNAGFRPAPYGRVWIKVRNGGGRKDWLLAKGPNFSPPSGTGTFTAYKRQLHGTSGKWLTNVEEAVTGVQASVARSIPKGRGSLALSRQSVVQIADGLGIDLLKVAGQGISGAGLAKARAALATTGKPYRNGIGIQGGNGTYDFIDLINRLPYGRKIGLDRNLLTVLAGRAKYFEQSYAKGAFDSQAKACRAYPNLFNFRAAA